MCGLREGGEVVTAPIITPALVRRYLLATGWTVDPDGTWRNHGLHAAHQPSGPWNMVGPIAVAREMGINRDELMARLGMLAAAERLHERVTHMERPGANLTSFGVSLMEELDREAEELAKAAGLTPEAWEEAKGR